MRISTKLAVLAGFSLALSFGVMTGTASADESNQTKINFNIAENLLSLSQAEVCMAAEITPDAPAEEVKKEETPTIETKKVLKNSNLPEGKFIINASAYTASADECGKSDGITASGAKVRENETIACPKSFAFGTKVNIEGYGTYICQDRGGAIKGNKIDIYVKTKTEAFAFGRRNLVAQIVTE
ncbi:MAG: 3D domain-containing protein [Candidatus Moranbacteria bacterium]|nr:3D domain-containing protein [Candidatus Moranbacteria bacterium]